VTTAPATDRQAPHSPDAERAVLAAILLDNAALATVGELEPREFYAPAHGRIFDAMQRLASAGEPVDAVTLVNALKRSGHLEAAGGPAYLGRLIEGMPRVANVAQWAREIRKHALSRRLAATARKLHDAALERGAEPEAVIERGLGALLALAGRASEEGFVSNAEVTKRAVVEIEQQAAAPGGVLGLRTGLDDLDRRLQGIRPGQLGLIAARLGSGKSILALQVAERVLLDQIGHAEEMRRRGEGGPRASRVAVYSLEMSDVAITKRRLAHRAAVPVSALHAMRPEEREQALARIAWAFDWVSRPELMLSTSAYTVQRMRALCRQVQAEHGLALVVVDYLQLVRAQQRHERRYLEVAEVSGDLKALAQDLRVPVVAVAQLNRAPEGRADKRPTMADLADGDSLGRDCDWAILINKEPPPKKGEPRDANKGIAELILDKNRDGWTGPVRVRFAGHISAFQALSHAAE